MKNNNEIPKTEIRICPECAGKAIVARGLKSKPCPNPLCHNGEIEVPTGTLLYPPVAPSAGEKKKVNRKKTAAPKVNVAKKKVTVTRTRVRKAASTADLLGKPVVAAV